MNIKKRIRYIQNLYAALHTLSGRCSTCNPNRADNSLVKNPQLKKKRNKDEYWYYLQLNPNQMYPGDLIRTYSEFRWALEQVLLFMEVDPNDFTVTRADLSFNSNDPEDYELFKKLNKLLICCISDLMNIQNCYESRDLWTMDSLSIAIKGDYIEAENYHKALENPNVQTKNRLELRSKRMRCEIAEEFRVKWAKRLDAAIDRFEVVQARYNEELVKIWNADVQKQEKERDFVSYTAFLMQFRDCIFTRNQLRELLALMGISNPEAAAKRFKDRHKVEFFSRTDLEEVVKALKHTMNEYFDA